MAQQETWIQPDCNIVFRVYDEQRFQIFLRIFNVLKGWSQPKASVESKPEDDTYSTKTFNRTEDWILAFRPQDLVTLDLPDHRESILALKSWRDLSRKERREKTREAPALQNLADFADIMKSFEASEYDLIECEKDSADSARLAYRPHQIPYEGILALENLLMFFGFFSLSEGGC